MAPEPKLPLHAINQVCVVVDNLQKTVERYWSVFGIGPWRIWTYGPHIMKEMTYRGRPASFRMKVALASVGPLIYEVIQPLDGESIYTEFLARHGAGMQHLGVFVDNIAEALSVLRGEGYEVVMSGGGHGLHGDGAFAYMGTEGDLAAMFELIQAPSDRRPPEATYP